jgi:hypothetical protein
MSTNIRLSHAVIGFVFAVASIGVAVKVAAGTANKDVSRLVSPERLQAITQSTRGLGDDPSAMTLRDTSGKPVTLVKNKP